MGKRKLITLALLFVLVSSFLGCATIKVGGNAQLVSSSQEGTKIAEQRYWYALWGLVPLGDNSTDPYIPSSVKKLRVETTTTFIDGLISFFTGIVTITCRTAEIYEVK